MHGRMFNSAPGSHILAAIVPKINPDAAKWAPEGQPSGESHCLMVIYILFLKNVYVCVYVYVCDRETEAERGRERQRHAWNNVETKRIREKMRLMFSFYSIMICLLF